MQVGGSLVAQELLPQLFVPDTDPADAHAGGDNLGEGAEHAALLTQLSAEAVGRGAGEAKLTVGVVLQQQDIAALEDLNDAVMHFLGIAQAGGILEVGDQVGEFGFRVIFDGLGQLVTVNAVGVHGNRQYDRVKHVEGLQGNQIGGVFDNDLVSGVDHGGADHGQGLLGAVGNDDVVGAHIVNAHGLIAAGNPLAQSRPAGGGAVLQSGDAVLLQNLFGCFFHLRDGEGDRVRQAARKGDDVRGCGGGQNGSRKLTLKIRLRNPVREMQFHFYTLLISECECLIMIAELT